MIGTELVPEQKQIDPQLLDDNKDNNPNNEHRIVSEDDIKVEYSVDHAINTIGKCRSPYKSYMDYDSKGPFLGVGLFQLRLLFLTGSVWAADAMEMMLLSFLLPTLAKEWELSGIVVSFIGAVVFFGMLIGGIILSILADRIGRRKVVITANAGCAVFGFLSGIAPNLAAMLVIRFLVGIFIGGGCVGYTLFAEYLPVKQRGKLLVYVCIIIQFVSNTYNCRTYSVQQAFWSFGALFSVFLAWVTLENLSWRYYVTLSSIPLWIVTFLFWVVPESVRYLSAAGKYDEAVQQLNYVSTFNNKPLPAGTLKREIPENGASCIEIFTQPTYRATSAKLYTIFWVCVFGYYGISFISERYFEQLYASGDVYQQMMITTASEIPALVVGVLLIDRIGRKRALTWSFFVFATCCLLLIIKSIQDFDIVGIALVFFARMWISVSYMMIFIYFSEYYPTTVRASALGGAVALGRTAGIGTTFAAEDMAITLGMWLYGCTGIVAFMASLLLPMDTTDVPMQDHLYQAVATQDEDNDVNRNQEQLVRRQGSREYYEDEVKVNE